LLSGFFLRRDLIDYTQRVGIPSFHEVLTTEPKLVVRPLPEHKLIAGLDADWELLKKKELALFTEEC